MLYYLHSPQFHIDNQLMPIFRSFSLVFEALFWRGLQTCSYLDASVICNKGRPHAGNEELGFVPAP
jgi:hypothetical protein